MNFKITGIPRYSINDSFRKFQESLENVTTIGFGSIRGYLALDGNNYLIGVDQNEITGEVECVEVAILFHGDTFEGIDLTNMPAESFAQELAKIGSTPIVEIDNIWWPKERMAWDSTCMRTLPVQFAGGETPLTLRCRKYFPKDNKISWYKTTVCHGSESRFPESSHIWEVEPHFFAAE